MMRLELYRGVLGLMGVDGGKSETVYMELPSMEVLSLSDKPDLKIFSLDEMTFKDWTELGYVVLSPEEFTRLKELKKTPSRRLALKRPTFGDIGFLVAISILSVIWCIGIMVSTMGTNNFAFGSAFVAGMLNIVATSFLTSIKRENT